MKGGFAARLAAFAAYAGALDRDVLSKYSDPSPAYRPKRKKLKGYQKQKRRGK